MYTLKQITTALRISRPRVEQWISRGFFHTPTAPDAGTARDWDLSAAMRLALFAELVEASISLKQARVLVPKTLLGFKNDEAYFVAWKGWHRAGVPGGKAYQPHIWFHETVPGRDLREFLGSKDVVIALAINLDHLEHRVDAALGASGKN